MYKVSITLNGRSFDTKYFNYLDNAKSFVRIFKQSHPQVKWTGEHYYGWLKENYPELWQILVSYSMSEEDLERDYGEDYCYSVKMQYNEQFPDDFYDCEISEIVTED